MVNKLKIKLHTGSIRYVTGINRDLTDFSYSIYTTNALEKSIDNIDKINIVLSSLKAKGLITPFKRIEII